MLRIEEVRRRENKLGEWGGAVFSKGQRKGPGKNHLSRDLSAKISLLDHARGREVWALAWSRSRQECVWREKGWGTAGGGSCVICGQMVGALLFGLHGQILSRGVT